MTRQADRPAYFRVVERHETVIIFTNAPIREKESRGLQMSAELTSLPSRKSIVHCIDIALHKCE